MRRVIGYKNYICFALVLFMIVIGIYLCEKQIDSSFALRMFEESVLTLGEDITSRRDTVYAKEEGAFQDVINNRGRINISRVIRYSKIREDNLQRMDTQHGMVHYLQELDIRLCRTDNLTQIFNVLYIHHQDGVKGARLFY